MSTNSNVDVYIRITCPKPGMQTKAFNVGQSLNIGHYDLVIDMPIVFNGRFNIPALNSDNSNRIEFAQPTFSWSTKSNVEISTLVNATDRARDDCDYFKWKFSTTTDKVEDLLDALEGITDPQNLPTMINGNTMIIFRPNDACTFHTYSVYDRNCFAAASVWMKTLGIDDLKNIVDSAPTKRTYTRVLDVQIGAFANWNVVH